MNGPNNYDEWDERNRKPPSFKGPKIDKETGDPGPRKPPKMDRITGEIVASTPEVKKEEVPKWRQKLKEIDGQGKDGKGKGGRLAGAAKVIDQFQGYREQAKWKGDDNPDPVRPGESKDPYTVTDEGYSGGMKSSEGPQTTLLRGIETEPKKKKKNKNYDY